MKRILLLTDDEALLLIGWYEAGALERLHDFEEEDDELARKIAATFDLKVDAPPAPPA